MQDNTDKEDALLGVAKTLRYGQEQVGAEIHKHNVLLGNLEDQVDNTTANLIYIYSKLKTLIAKTDPCYLWIIIIIEIIALILIALFV